MRKKLLKINFFNEVTEISTNKKQAIILNHNTRFEQLVSR